MFCTVFCDLCPMCRSTYILPNPFIGTERLSMAPKPVFFLLLRKVLWRWVRLCLISSWSSTFLDTPQRSIGRLVVASLSPHSSQNVGEGA